MTDIQDYLAKMKLIQTNIEEFLDNDGNFDESFQQLIDIFNKQNIKDNKHELKSIIHMIAQITNNYHRLPGFYHKILSILQFFKDQIAEYYTNQEIFLIFKNCKRILLFLFEQKLLSVDKHIANYMIYHHRHKENYQIYFFPELKPFLNEKMNKKISKLVPEDFHEKRKLGENEEIICELIRNDDINEFVSFVNKNGIELNSLIELSIFETNLFFLEKQEAVSLIEYAAFFGSIQIFKFLLTNKADLLSPLWKFAIHGRNSEIIHLLEERVKYAKSYKELIFESMKCHHNDLMFYFQNNYEQDENDDSHDLLKLYLKYYNFELIESENIDDLTFPLVCKYDYYILVDFLLKQNGFDLNIYSIFVLNHLMTLYSIFKRYFNFFFHSTGFNNAVKKGNIEIARYLLSFNDLDVNLPNIII